MVISISGTHCTGKSTLIEILKKSPVFENAVFLKSSGRALKKCISNLKINEDGDFFSQFYMLSRDITQLTENIDKPLVVCDRSFLDTWVYSKYLHRNGCLRNTEMDILDKMKESASMFFHFDKIFILKPSYELVQEENRSMSVEFQKDVELLFDELLNPYNNSVEVLPSSDEERAEIIINFIKNNQKQ